MYKNTLRAVLMPVLLAVFLAAGVLAGIRMGRPSAQNQSGTGSRALSPANDKLSQTLALIRSMYVDRVDIDSIVERVMPALMDELDPHSVYIPASERAAANETLEGEFDGIGVVFNMATDTAIVLNVIPGGPSEKAGVMAGDRIIRIDGDTVAGRRIPQDNIVSKLRGRRGTMVTISVERRRSATLLDIPIERGKIPLKSIDAAFMIRPGIGFLKLSSFARTSHSEMIEALDGLKAQGMTGLIFDLRGNSGGFLGQAIEITNEFLPERKLIVYTENQRRQRTEEFSKGNGRYTDVALVVLIDEGSASASEILAGAIQDNDRGTVVGRRSFGKGLVQEQVDFADGSQLRLTVARYYTPTGRSIQKPYDEGSEAYRRDLSDRFEHSEFFTADSIRFADSLRFVTPGGKVVYGGGGIMPDVFVPLDTTQISPFYLSIVDRNILYKYALDYSDRIRDRLDAVRTVDELNALLDSDPKLVDGLIGFAERQGVKPVWADIKVSRTRIESQLRAYIGRNSPLGDIGFYANIYTIDPAIMTAIDVLERPRSTATNSSD